MSIDSRPMSSPRRPRLDPAIFNLPVDKMRAGYYSDKYFVRARDMLRADGHSPHVTVQVFGKADAFLGGIDEAIAILKLCSDDWGELEVRALHDGDPICPWDVVLEIEGPYNDFVHLETLYLGVLARRTRVGVWVHVHNLLSHRVNQARRDDPTVALPVIAIRRRRTEKVLSGVGGIERI